MGFEDEGCIPDYGSVSVITENKRRFYIIEIKMVRFYISKMNVLRWTIHMHIIITYTLHACTRIGIVYMRFSLKSNKEYIHL